MQNIREWYGASRYVAHPFRKHSIRPKTPCHIFTHRRAHRRAHSDHASNYQADGYAYRSTDLSNDYFVRNGKADEWASAYAERIQQHLDAKETSFSIDADNASFPPSISGIQNALVAYRSSTTFSFGSKS